MGDNDGESSETSMSHNTHGVPRSPRAVRLDGSGLSMPPSQNSPRPTEKRIRFVHELPLTVELNLCRHLDADKKWEMLAGLMQIDRIDIKLIANVILRGDSPAQEVLRKFGEKNGRISQVFKYLYEMGYYKGMDILKNYVDPAYWTLLPSNNNSGDLSSTHLSNCFGRPSAPPCESDRVSIKPNLQLDSHNLYSPRREDNLKGNISKLPSPTAQTNDSSQIGASHGAGIAEAAAACVQNPGKAEIDRLNQELLSSGVKVLSIKGRVPQKLHKMNVDTKTDFKDIDLEPINHIPYAELAQATGDFANENILGRGGFGAVYRGNWKDITVAVKKLHWNTKPEHRPNVQRGRPPPARPGAQREDEELVRILRIRSMLTELRVLEKCRFQHILALYGVSIDNMNEPCIVYEYMPGGSLDDRLKRKQHFASERPLTWQQRASIAIGAARGLNYLHTQDKQPLVHGDIKPANILLDANLQSKLGDFGLTREGPEGDRTHRNVSHLQGTEWYLPFEYRRSKQLSTKVDVYSFGLVLLELATNLLVHDERRQHRLLSSHVAALKNPLQAKDPTGGDEAGSNNIVDLFIKLGLQCAADEKKDRPEMHEVLEALKGAATSSLSIAAGYSGDPTATMHHVGTAGWQQGGWNGTLAVPQNLPEIEARRLSPSDNLQVGPSSPVPPYGMTLATGGGNMASQQSPPQAAMHKPLNYPSPPMMAQGYAQMHPRLQSQAQYQQQQQQRFPPSYMPFVQQPFRQPNAQYVAQPGHVNNPVLRLPSGVPRTQEGQQGNRMVYKVPHYVLNQVPNAFSNRTPSPGPSSKQDEEEEGASANKEVQDTAAASATGDIPGASNAPAYAIDPNCLPLVPALEPEPVADLPQLTVLGGLSTGEHSTSSTNTSTTNNSLSTSDSSTDISPN